MLKNFNKGFSISGKINGEANYKKPCWDKTVLFYGLLKLRFSQCRQFFCCIIISFSFSLSVSFSFLSLSLSWTWHSLSLSHSVHLTSVMIPKQLNPQNGEIFWPWHSILIGDNCRWGGLSSHAIKGIFFNYDKLLNLSENVASGSLPLLSISASFTTEI